MATLAKIPIRRFINLTAILLVMGLAAGRAVIADEQSPITPAGPVARRSVQPSLIDSGQRFNWVDFNGLGQRRRIEMPRRPRISRSRRPVRQVTLVGGDRFLGECLNWSRDRCAFRLLNGRTIEVPTVAMAFVGNPPNEIDVIDESFEVNVAAQSDLAMPSRHDDRRAPDGSRVLKLSEADEFDQKFPPFLNAARIEFSFRAVDLDRSSGSGEWTLMWGSDKSPAPRVTVQVGPDRQIRVMELLPRQMASIQSLGLADGWHSCIILVTADRTRLIVDEAILATFATPECALQSIRFRSAGEESRNSLLLDAFQVRCLEQPDDNAFDRDDSLTQDIVLMSSGDQLFGRVRTLERQIVQIDAFHQVQTLPWTQIAGVSLFQSPNAIRQTTRPRTGVVSAIEMQSFTDRPGCEPEHWVGTIVRSDADRVVLQHPLIGEVPLRWNEIRRIDARFFGRSQVIDARQFHLGNSIRSDFHRQRPDGTELVLDAVLADIPAGSCFLSVDVAELEAASPEAPPATPFLAEVRAGHLVTELIINDQSLGNLNSHIRFKAAARSPDRLRLVIPRGVLKMGSNTILLKQRPRKDASREFDDCELGDFRLDFDTAEPR